MGETGSGTKARHSSGARARSDATTAGDSRQRRVRQFRTKRRWSEMLPNRSVQTAAQQLSAWAWVTGGLSRGGATPICASDSSWRSCSTPSELQASPAIQRRRPRCRRRAQHRRDRRNTPGHGHRSPSMRDAASCVKSLAEQPIEPVTIVPDTQP